MWLRLDLYNKITPCRDSSLQCTIGQTKCQLGDGALHSICTCLYVCVCVHVPHVVPSTRHPPSAAYICLKCCQISCWALNVCVSVSVWVAKGSPTLCCTSKPHQPCLSLLIIFIQAARQWASGKRDWSLPFWLRSPLLLPPLTILTANEPGGRMVRWIKGGRKSESVAKKHVVPSAYRDFVGGRVIS